MEYSVAIEGAGRSGTVVYTEGGNQLRFYFELMTGELVASVFIGSGEVWADKEQWCRLRREEIARRIGDEIVRLKVPGGRAELDREEGYLDIFPKTGE